MENIELVSEITDIYNFVNKEFNIEDNSILDEIKRDLTEENIIILDNMLHNYNKKVKVLKRAEQQRKAQKLYKKIGTNLKEEEYLPIEEKATELKISISELVKLSLKAFIGSKTADSEEMVALKDLDALKAKYDTIESELKSKTNDILALNEKLTENTKNIEENKSLKLEITRLEKDKNLLTTDISKLKTENIRLKLLEDETIPKLEKRISEAETADSLEISKLKITNTEMISQIKEFEEENERYNGNYYFRIAVLGFALLGINSLFYLIFNFFHPLNLI